MNDDSRSAARATRRREILEFLMLADRLKSVVRRADTGDRSRRENSAEHSWHVALCALVLSAETGSEIDIGRVLSLIVVHDLVEIYAGDTPAYDHAAKASEREREEEAARRLFGGLPEGLRVQIETLRREFDAGETVEARFALACDRLQGFMQNVLTDGSAWRAQRTRRADTYMRMHATRTADPEFAALLDILYERADAARLWLDDHPRA
jgi:putative hydrolase of HD superfamily